MSITVVKVRSIECDECGSDNYDCEGAETHLSARKEAADRVGWTWYTHIQGRRRFVRDLCPDCSKAKK